MAQVPFHLLLPTELDARVWHALQFAFQLGLEMRTRVTLLHVVPSSDSGQPRQGLDAIRHLHDALHLPPETAHFAPTFAKHLHRELHSIATRLHRRIHPEWSDYLDVQTVSRRGDVAREIVRYSEEAGADMIVLGTRPRRAWWNWRNSVSHAVLKQATCRVVLVHDPPPAKSASAPSLLAKLTFGRFLRCPELAGE